MGTRAQARIGGGAEPAHVGLETMRYCQRRCPLDLPSMPLLGHTAVRLGRPRAYPMIVTLAGVALLSCSGDRRARHEIDHLPGLVQTHLAG